MIGKTICLIGVCGMIGASLGTPKEPPAPKPEKSGYAVVPAPILSYSDLKYENQRTNKP